MGLSAVVNIWELVVIIWELVLCYHCHCAT